MAEFLRNLGMEYFAEDEEALRGLIAYSVNEGKVVMGYDGPYINMHYDWAQIIVKIKSNEEEKKVEVTEVDTHADGNCKWKVAVSADLSFERESTKRLMVTRADDSSGMAIINVVNQGVLPSYLEGDVYEFQMIGFPEQISYYASEEEYNDSLEKDDLGRTFGIAEGTVFPSGFLKNHQVNNEDMKTNSWMDDLVLVRGTVKRLHVGQLKFGEESFNAYIRCIIDTQFGELELDHVFEQVDETQRENIKVGATVFAVCVLSADPANGIYAEGIVKDEEHHLMVLRQTFVKGDADRLRYILDNDAVHVTDHSKEKFCGVDSIIERFKYVHEKTTHTYYAHKAVITEVDDGDEPLSYGLGKNCLVLASDNPNNYESIAFIDVNEEGAISKILITVEPRYHFRILDSGNKRELPEDLVFDNRTYKDAMFMRARFLNFVDYEADINSYLTEDNHMATDKKNVEGMLELWPEDVEKGDEKHMELLFGYLFAKSIEAAYTDRISNSGFHPRRIVGYFPDAAWNDELDTPYEGKIRTKLKIAMKYGKQFYKDFMLNVSIDDENYEEELVNALIFVQRLGRRSAPEFMKTVTEGDGV